MKIQAAAYGCERLIFLADSVSDSDLISLLCHLSKGGLANQSKRDNDAYREIDLTNQGRYAGGLIVAPQVKGIQDKTKLTLMPYLGRLREPKFMAGEVGGEDAIRGILGQYDFLMIEAIDQQSMIDYNTRFSDLAKRPCIRVQPQQDQEMSVAIGHSWLNI